MTKEGVQQGLKVITQFREALGYSQRALAREWGCTADKVWRAERGTEPTFTLKEIKAIGRWLKEEFGKTWDDLPDSMLSTEPIDFLQHLIESHDEIPS